MATYINKQGETIVMKLKDMSVEQKKEYRSYITKKNYYKKGGMNDKLRKRARMYQRSKKRF